MASKSAKSDSPSSPVGLVREEEQRILAIDLFCGLGGWTEGLLAEGYRVVGFDMERHRYPARAISDSDGTKVREAGVDFNNPAVGSSRNRSFNYANECAMKEAPLTGGWDEYPAQLVLQDVLTIHGSQFKDAALIVASPPCQEYSYMAMPWSRAKQIAVEYRDGTRDRARLTALFDACFRIQREAIEAAGHHIPLVVENVCGAQKWVGKAQWHYGSFYLWGDVPALMPITRKSAKVAGFRFDGSGKSFQTASVQETGTKTTGHVNKRDGHSHTRHLTNQAESDGIKHGGDCFNDPTWAGKQGGTKQPGITGPRANGKGDRWFQDGAAQHGSKSSARKAASAHIAKIPYELARHIGRSWKPYEATA